jgi:hypothetical protein
MVLLAVSERCERLAVVCVRVQVVGSWLVLGWRVGVAYIQS